MNSSSMQFIFIFIFKFDRPILDFLQIKFYIETRFWENSILRKSSFNRGAFPYLVWENGQNADFFAREGHLPILAGYP